MKTKHLTIEDLQKLEDQYINWHPNYHQEGWRDGLGPLFLLNIWHFSGTNIWAISYKCSKKECMRCKNPHSITGQFHVKVIKENGMDAYGYSQEVKINKKKSEMQLIEQPVFQFYSF